MKRIISAFSALLIANSAVANPLSPDVYALMIGQHIDVASIVEQAPVLVTAPSVSPNPAVVQEAQPNSANYDGNTVTVSNGTWTGCGADGSACTYQYQWWTGTGFRQGTLAPVIGATNASYTVQPSTRTTGGALTFATVTAINAAGAAMAVTPFYVNETHSINGTPVQVTPPRIEKCTDSSCTATVALGNTLGVGDWLKVVDNGTYTNPDGSAISISSFTYGWVTQSEAAGGSPQALLGTNPTFQITTNLNKSPSGTIPALDSVIWATVTAHTSLGGTPFRTAAAGAIQADQVTVIPAPGITLTLPTLTYNPAGTSGAYEGGYLAYPELAEGRWEDVSFADPATQITFQPYYCNSNTCTTPATPQTLLDGTPIGPPAVVSQAGGGFHLMNVADIGHKIFFRVTVSNQGGTTQADTPPSDVISLPPPPVQSGDTTVSGGGTTPTITGLAVYGNVGAVNGSNSPVNGGGYLVGDYGPWVGATSITAQWFSCPPATPTCTTPALGPTSLTPGPPAYQRQGSVYTPVSSDVGHVLWMQANAENLAVLASGGVKGNSPATPTVTSYTPPAEITHTALRTYPAGHDLAPGATTCASEPADSPDAGGVTWHVDQINGDTPNSTFGGTGTADGTAAHPFNSLKGVLLGGVTGYSRALLSTNGTGSNWTPGSPKTNFVNPGDRIIVEGSPTSSPRTEEPQIAFFGSPKNTAGTSGTGATKWVKIIADPASTFPPMIDGLAVAGAIGLEFTGFTIRPAPNKTMSSVGTATVGASSTPSRDIIIADGLIGPFDNMTDAVAAYTNACVTNSCSSSNFPKWLTTLVTGNAASVSGVGTACVAIDNNLMQFTGGAASTIGIFPRSVLIENNEAHFIVNNDYMDYQSSALIFHGNYLHDPMGGVGAGTHVDFHQAQPWNNVAYWGLYGVEMEGERLYEATQADYAVLKNFNDPKVCVTNSHPSNCTDLPQDYTGETSAEEGTGNYYTGHRVTNMVYIGSGKFSPPRSSLGTYANNTLMSLGTASGNAANFAVTGLSSDYVANITANEYECSTPLPFVAKNTLAVPFGTGNSLPPSVVPACIGGITAIATGTPSPFVSFTAGAQPYVQTSDDFHPATGGILKGTGVAGNGAPTVDNQGTTRANPPSIGGFE